MSENFKLGEVVLNVQDLAKMTSFYSDVIGLVKLNETEGSAAFGAKKRRRSITCFRRTEKWEDA